jgi:hypothetical protein
MDMAVTGIQAQPMPGKIIQQVPKVMAVVTAVAKAYVSL